MYLKASVADALASAADGERAYTAAGIQTFEEAPTLTKAVEAGAARFRALFELARPERAIVGKTGAMRYGRREFNPCDPRTWALGKSLGQRSSEYEKHGFMFVCGLVAFSRQTTPPLCRNNGGTQQMAALFTESLLQARLSRDYPGLLTGLGTRGRASGGFGAQAERPRAIEMVYVAFSLPRADPGVEVGEEGGASASPSNEDERRRLGSARGRDGSTRRGSSIAKTAQVAKERPEKTAQTKPNAPGT